MCPKDMGKTLGATTLSPPNGGPPATLGEELELTVTISPQGVLNVGMVAPTLRTWSVTYRCVDYE